MGVGFGVSDLQLVTIRHQFSLFSIPLLFQIPHSNSLRLGVGDFAPGAFADVATDVDDKDIVCVHGSFVCMLNSSYKNTKLIDPLPYS